MRPFMAERTLDHLRRGARIHTLIFAVHVGRGSDRPYDLTWDGLHYARNDRSGARGVVAFSKAGVIGVFFDPTKADAQKKPPKLDTHFAKAPPALMQLAKREVLDVFDIGKGPAITAAFWSDNTGQLVGARPWPKLLPDGAALVEQEMHAPDKAIDAFAERYALEAPQVDIVRKFFGGEAAKSSTPAGKVQLAREDVVALGLLVTPRVKELLEGAGVELI